MLKKITIIVGICAIASGALAAPPKKLLVDQLKATNMKASAADAVGMAICHQASEDKRFDVACTSEVKPVLAYDTTMAMLGAETNCEGDCNERLGKQMLSEYIVTGGIAKLAKGKYLLTLELIDTPTAKVLGRVEEQVNGSGDVTIERARGAVKKLLAQLK